MSKKYVGVDLDLTPLLMEKLGKKYRKIGRYSVSDLYAMQAGWLTPELYLHPEPVNFIGLMRMLSGIVMHEKIQMLYKKECCEVKVVYDYKDITLVAKCDYLPPEDSPEMNEIYDFKTSETIMDKMKPWAKHQIKMYCTLFKREIGRIYQPLIINEKFILKDLGSVERDDEWFEQQCEKLYLFHQRVVALAIKEGIITEYVKPQ